MAKTKEYSQGQWSCDKWANISMTLGGGCDGYDEGAWLRPDTQWRKMWIPFALHPISTDAIRRSLDTASFVLAWRTGRAEWFATLVRLMKRHDCLACFPQGKRSLVVSLLTPGKESCLFPITGVSYEIRKSRIFLQVSVRWKASSFVAFYWYLVFYDFVNKSDGGEKTESKRFLGRFSETDIEFFGTCEYPFPLLFGSNFLKNQTLSAKDEFYVFFT